MKTAADAREAATIAARSASTSLERRRALPAVMLADGCEHRHRAVARDTQRSLLLTKMSESRTVKVGATLSLGRW